MFGTQKSGDPGGMDPSPPIEAYLKVSRLDSLAPREWVWAMSQERTGIAAGSGPDGEVTVPETVAVATSWMVTSTPVRSSLVPSGIVTAAARSVTPG